MLDALLSPLSNVLNDTLDRLRLEPLGPRSALTGALFFLVLKYCLNKATRRTYYIKRLATVGRQLEDQVKQSSSALDTPEYDFVIVGGGTAGCVLAARLTEDPTVKVLVLEAGGSGAALPESRIPATYSRLYFNKRFVHSFYTESQPEANGKEMFWPRAKLLGGCTSINAQMAQYGAPSDFDEWASIAGDGSWSWKNFSRYFRKFEKYDPNPEYPQVDASARGNTGPVQVGYFNTATSTCLQFVQACVNAGIAFTPDFNGPNGPLGASRIMTYVSEKRQRVSAETAYLTPSVLARPNLKVAIHAQVTRLLFDDSNKTGKPRAVGVEFAQTGDGPRFVAWVRKEVLLCAGAVQSPQILMLSGVGPAAHLKEHDIPVVLDVPGVGQHLLDHPLVDLYFQRKAEETSISFMKPTKFSHKVKLINAALRYKFFRTGPLAVNWVDAAAFVRSDDAALFPADEYPENLEDTTSGKGAPDLELFSSPQAYMPHGTGWIDGPSLGLHCYLLRPASKGSITLKSNNPFDYPKIDPRYLSAPSDLTKLVRAVRLAARLAYHEPINALLDHTSTRSDLDHHLNLKSDSEVEDLVRRRLETVYHPTSTCRMAPRDVGGVVDASLRVYGLQGLRVCDASVFPSIPSGHTAAAVYATAEKLADDIKAGR